MGRNKLTIYIIMCISMFLSSCTTKHSAAGNNKYRNINTTDTNRLSSASSIVSNVRIDTTKTSSVKECSVVVEFVDDGGSVSIDSTGVRLTGVKNIKNNRKAHDTSTKAIDEESRTEIKMDNQSGGTSNSISEGSSRTKDLTVKSSRQWMRMIIVVVMMVVCIYVVYRLYRKRLGK